MRARYQTNPKIAALGMALSLGLIFGAGEVRSGVVGQETEAGVHIDATGQVDSVGLVDGAGHPHGAVRAQPVMSVEPAARTIVEATDERTC